MRGLLPIAVAAAAIASGVADLSRRQPQRGRDRRRAAAVSGRHARSMRRGCLTQPAPGAGRDATPRRRRATSTTDRRDWTSPTCAARRSGGARWRSRRPARITCCSAARRAPARRCWRGGCRGCCRRCRSTRRSRSRRFIRSPGLLPPGAGLVRTRPFRAPHHTCSDIALVGGGSHPRPGELSLAHHGVLFLDELPEFSRRVLETLRQPLEQGVGAHRARRAGGDLSRAGHARRRDESVSVRVLTGSRQRTCRCPPAAVERYRRRLSGPLRDRFDLGLDLPAVPWAEIAAARPASRRRPCGRGSSRPAAASSIGRAALNGRPRGTGSSRRHCAAGDTGRRKPARPGRPPVRIKRSGRDARTTRGPDDRRPGGRPPASTRATWQRPCTSACRIASLQAEIPGKTG